jgi:hypothetical protein
MDNRSRERCRRAVQASLLDRMSEVVRRVEQKRSPPWARFVAVAAPLAWLLGHLFGEAVYSCVEPWYGYMGSAGRNRPLLIYPLIAGIAMGLLWLVGLLVYQFWTWSWHLSRLGAEADRLEGQLQAVFPDYGSAGGTAGLRDADAVTLVARRAAGHESLTQPSTPELRSTLLAELRQLLDMQERR